MAASDGVRCALAINVQKCDHGDSVKTICTFPSKYTVAQVFGEVHPEFQIKEYAITASGSAAPGFAASSAGDQFELEWGLSVGDLVNQFHVKSIRFACLKTRTEEEAT